MTQTSQVTPANNVSQITNSESGKRNPNIKSAQITSNTQLTAQIQIQGQSASIPTKLSLQQLNLLNNQSLLAVMQQQHVQLFLQSQLSKTSLTIPSELSLLLSNWLKDPKSDISKNLPKTLLTFLSLELGKPETELKHKLQSLLLRQSIIEIHFLQGEPIVQIKMPRSQTATLAEQILPLLQFIIPVEMQDKATLIVKQHESTTIEDEDTGLEFELTFNLEKLGQLLIKVSLNEFDLKTECVCQNLKLQQQVEKHWPLLSERLNKLGFNTENKIKLKPEITNAASLNSNNSLINIKV